LVRRSFDDSQMPYVALVGNKCTRLIVLSYIRLRTLTMMGSWLANALVAAADLNHLRAVKAAKHKQFAEENDLKSFFVSAKTGDQVNASFRQIAADLAGIALTRTDLDVEAPVLKAQIINHEQHDPDVKTPDIRSNTRSCCLQ